MAESPYISRLIAEARENGEMDQSFIDRLIENDERGFAKRDERALVSRTRTAASIVGGAMASYYEAAKSLPMSDVNAPYVNAESPIESALIFALTRFSQVRVSPVRDLHIDEVINQARKSDLPVMLFQQIIASCYDECELLGSYRLDFLVTVKLKDNLKLLCVEADGVKNHYTELDQVIRDNRRTAHLASRGVFTIRFTGKEIYYEIEQCVDVITSVIRCWGVKEIG